MPVETGGFATFKGILDSVIYLITHFYRFFKSPEATIEKVKYELSGETLTVWLTFKIKRHGLFKKGGKIRVACNILPVPVVTYGLRADSAESSKEQVIKLEDLFTRFESSVVREWGEKCPTIGHEITDVCKCEIQVEVQQFLIRDDRGLQGNERKLSYRNKMDFALKRVPIKLLAERTINQIEIVKGGQQIESQYVHTNHSAVARFTIREMSNVYPAGIPVHLNVADGSQASGEIKSRSTELEIHLDFDAGETVEIYLRYA